jgi:multidrug resistance efflux pump
MNHKRIIPAIFLLLLVIGFSAYFIVTQATSKQGGALTASGTIEATQVNIAPELAGKVQEVFVDEGQQVKANAPLLSLDGSLLAAQRAAAAAAVDSARTQYDLALIAAQAEDAKARARNWSIPVNDRFDYPNWYFMRTEQINGAKSELAAAQAAYETAKANLDSVVKDVNNADFVNAEARVLQARAAYEVMKGVDSRAETADDHINLLNLDDTLTDTSESVFQSVKDELTAAQRAYNDMLTTDQAKRVLKARAELAVAEERYRAAQDYYQSLLVGYDSPRIQAAAQSLKQAEANLALIDTQIAKLTISSPMDGVILTRNVEPGEFIQPGATAFVLGQLNNLTITVYVPEDRYGEISIGQSAQVTVDSFPGEVFTATVIKIADSAEFTPRNVQTVQGRSSTVYAIKLSVANTDGKLKIGMPADVAFK